MIRSRAVAAAAAIALTAALAAAAPASAGASCVSIPGHHAQLCVQPHVAGHGTAYVTDLLENNWLYVNPAGSGGDEQVQETLIKGAAPGHVPGGIKRAFGLADGALIADAAWLASPSYTTPPAWCVVPGDPPTVTHCSTLQQGSAMNAWFVTEHSGIHHSY
jgi:hypothetical protein